MNFVSAALANDNPHRHADLDSRNISIDKIGHDLRPLFQSNDRNDVRKPLREIWMIRFVENDKGANRSPT